MRQTRPSSSHSFKIKVLPEARQVVSFFLLFFAGVCLPYFRRRPTPLTHIRADVSNSVTSSECARCVASPHRRPHPPTNAHTRTHARTPSAAARHAGAHETQAAAAAAAASAGAVRIFRTRQQNLTNLTWPSSISHSGTLISLPP